MSRYTCLVLGEDPGMLLAPFGEGFAAETDEEGYPHNPRAKWDWWVVGGRWSNTLTTRTGEAVDRCRVSDLALEAVKPPFAILDGETWHERGEMGRFATVSDEKSEDDWVAEVGRVLAAASPDTIVTLCDLHIW